MCLPEMSCTTELCSVTSSISEKEPSVVAIGLEVVCSSDVSLLIYLLKGFIVFTFFLLSFYKSLVSSK